MSAADEIKFDENGTWIPQEHLDGLKQVAEDFRGWRTGHFPRMDAPEWAGGEFRRDGAETFFTARSLEYVRKVAFEVKYQALKADTFIPWGITPIDPGAEFYTIDILDVVGKAQVTRDLAGDVPEVDIKRTSATQSMASIRLAYSYTFQDARAALMAGKPLVTTKATKCRWLMQRDLDSIALIGDPLVGTGKGLFNSSGTDSYTVPATGSGNSTLFDNKTPDQVVIDMQAPAGQVYANTKENEIVTDIIVPTTVWNLLNQRRVGDGTSMSLLAYVKANAMQPGSGRPFSIDSSPYLETLGSGSTRRMVSYKKDPENMEMLISVAFEQFAPQNRGARVVTDCHMRTGGFGLTIPKSVIYSDNV